jgi:hypothetical protein
MELLDPAGVQLAWGTWRVSNWTDLRESEWGGTWTDIVIQRGGEHVLRVTDETVQRRWHSRALTPACERT